LAEYSYKYGGRDYKSDQVSFSHGYDNIGNYWCRCYRVLDNDRKHDIATCRVNPSVPSDAVIFADMRWGMIGVKMLFVVVCGGMGFGMLGYAMFGYGKGKNKKSMLQQKYPGQPWMWKPDWHDGVIRSDSKAAMVGVLLFSIFWNAIGFPIGMMAFVDGVRGHGSPLAMIGLVFPVIGIGLILGTIYLVIGYLKYGKAVFSMDSVPGVVGGSLSGVIKVPGPMRNESGFKLRLCCVHQYVEGSGKESSTEEDVLWEDSVKYSADIAGGGVRGVELPVLFAIPFDLPSSSTSGDDDCIIWRLTANAHTKGVDFASRFEVPVFETEESREDFVLDDSAIRPYLLNDSVEDVFARQGVYLEKGSRGVCYHFSAARHKGLAVGVAIGAFALSAAVAGCVYLGVTIWVTAIFALLAAFMVWLVVGLLLVSSRIDIAHRTVTVTRGILGLAIPKSVSLKNVEDVFSKESSQTGDTVYYTIKLRTSEGKDMLLADNIEGKSDARMITEHIRQALAADY
jgi:hypothetical protein